MSSFSRGFARHHGLFILQTTRAPCGAIPRGSQLLIQLRLLRPSRSIQSSSRSLAAASPAAPPKTTAHITITPATTAAAAAKARPRSYAELLARKGGTTTLYEAPSHFWYRASSLGAGAFCITYTLVNYWSIYLWPPADLTWWVPHAFGVICIAMVGMGTYFLRGGSRIVRTVRALPAAQAQAIGGRVVGAGGPPSPLYLEVEIGRVLPLLPARKLYVRPDEFELPFRLALFGLEGGGEAAAAAALTGPQRVAARRAEEERKKKEREYEMNHLMTAPFRHAWRGAKTAWGGIRRAFSREGFANVGVRGSQYKLDVSGGWALENGRALDRLVTIKDNSI